MSRLETRADGPLGQRLLVVECEDALSCSVKQGGKEVAGGPGGLGLFGSRMAGVLKDVPPARRHLGRARASLAAALGLTVPTAAALAAGGMIGFGAIGQEGSAAWTRAASALFVSGLVLFAVSLLVAENADTELSRGIQAYNLETVRRFESTLVPVLPPPL